MLIQRCDGLGPHVLSPVWSACAWYPDENGFIDVPEDVGNRYIEEQPDAYRVVHISKPEG